MPWVGGRVHASHRLPTSWDIDLERSVLKAPVFMKVPHHVRQLWRHVEDGVPQPAHKSQSAARSVERAMAASHDATLRACKATDDAAHLVRLWSARRSLHREGRRQVRYSRVNLCLKGLRLLEYRAPRKQTIPRFCSKLKRKSSRVYPRLVVPFLKISQIGRSPRKFSHIGRTPRKFSHIGRTPRK